MHGGIRGRQEPGAIPLLEEELSSPLDEMSLLLETSGKESSLQ